MGTPAPREMRLLLSLLHADATAYAKEQIESLCAEPFCWNSFLRAAAWHGVTGLAAQSLRTGSLMPALPIAAREALEQDVRERMARSMKQVAGLAQIQHAIENVTKSATETSALPLLCWKGPTLSHALYGSYTLRASSDLDFLVRRQDMPRILDLLKELGFKEQSPWTSGAASLQAAHLNCEVQLSRARDQLQLELHDELMPRMFGRWLSIEGCLERSVWTKLDPRTRVRTLAPHDLLISLCAHGSKHGWERLKWVCDVAAFVRSHGTEMQWEQLLLEAKQASALDAVLDGVELAARLLGAARPEVFKSYAKQQRATGRTVSLVTERLQSGVLERQTSRDGLHDALATTASRKARALYLLRRFFYVNALDVESFRLPRSLYALYYPLRLVRLAVKELRGMLPGPASATNR